MKTKKMLSHEYQKVVISAYGVPNKTKMKHTAKFTPIQQLKQLNGVLENVQNYFDEVPTKTAEVILNDLEECHQIIEQVVNSHEALVEALLKLRKAFYVDNTHKALKQAFSETHEIIENAKV